MIFPGIRAAVIYDPATGTTVQIDKPTANTFEFSQSRFDTGDRDAFGQLLDQGDESACSFDFVDTDGTKFLQLDAWAAARTRVSMVAVGKSVCVQWYETDRFVCTRTPSTGVANGRGDKYSFSMFRQGHGFHSIYQQTNLVGHVGGRGVTSWSEEGATDLAKGYTDLALGTLEWIDLTGAQGVTHDDPDAGIYVDIVFPLQLSGYTISLTSEITDVHTDTSTAKIRIQGRNFAGTQVLNGDDESGVGRNTASFATAPGSALYTVRVFPILTPTGVTTSDQVDGKEPVVRVDSLTTFIEN